MRRIVGYRFPATKSGGFTTKPLIAVPSRLLKLIGSTGPSLTRESHASFWRDSGRSVVPSSANTSAGASGVDASTASLPFAPAANALTTRGPDTRRSIARSEEHTSELQSHSDLVCRLLLEKKKSISYRQRSTNDVGM